MGKGSGGGHDQGVASTLWVSEHCLHCSGYLPAPPAESGARRAPIEGGTHPTIASHSASKLTAVGELCHILSREQHSAVLHAAIRRYHAPVLRGHLSNSIGEHGGVRHSTCAEASISHPNHNGCTHDGGVTLVAIMSGDMVDTKVSGGATSSSALPPPRFPTQQPHELATGRPPFFRRTSYSMQIECVCRYLRIFLQAPGSIWRETLLGYETPWSARLSIRSGRNPPTPQSPVATGVGGRCWAGGCTSSSVHPSTSISARSASRRIRECIDTSAAAYMSFCSEVERKVLLRTCSIPHLWISR